VSEGWPPFVTNQTRRELIENRIHSGNGTGYSMKLSSVSIATEFLAEAVLVGEILALPGKYSTL